MLIVTFSVLKSVKRIFFLLPVQKHWATSLYIRRSCLEFNCKAGKYGVGERNFPLVGMLVLTAKQCLFPLCFRSLYLSGFIFLFCAYPSENQKKRIQVLQSKVKWLINLSHTFFFLFFLNLVALLGIGNSGQKFNQKNNFKKRKIIWTPVRMPVSRKNNIVRVDCFKKISQICISNNGS